MFELTKENFEKEVLEAKGVVFVDFWSPKCEPCMALLPDVEDFVKRNEGRAKFCKLDTAGNKRLAISQKVMGIPTFVFYKDGEKAFVFDKDSIDMSAVQQKLDDLLG
ncbi:MAG TPA: thioredoxin [Desulfitobacterium dehalogenans]|uniref:Thioredoxin n=1 Tax=Desulfitobacterium dehalogenans TaxID=36854 RepID=A0A7C7D8L3_9FIRM|nr:thioredoxin [Desulfitobacterium dehalogenans]